MILVFGSINLDLVYELEAMPQAGQTLLARTMSTEPGGKGANQAVAAALDGAEVAFVGAIGDDAIAEAATTGLAAAGVDLSRVATVDAPTGNACICIDASGANQIVVAAGANALASQLAVEDALLVPGATLLLQMEVTAGETEALIRRAAARGVRTILNLAPAAPIAEDTLRALALLIVNEDEGLWLLDHLGGAGEGGALALQRLLGITVVRTLGGAGVEWAEDGIRHRLAGHAVDVRDTTAAGDCFVGVLAAALDRGDGLHDAIVRANVAASIACTRSGSQRSLPDRATIDAAVPFPTLVARPMLGVPS